MGVLLYTNTKLNLCENGVLVCPICTQLKYMSNYFFGLAFQNGILNILQYANMAITENTSTEYILYLSGTVSAIMKNKKVAKVM